MYMCIRITNATPSAWREDTFFHDKVVLFMMLPLLLKVAQLEKKSISESEVIKLPLKQILIDSPKRSNCIETTKHFM